MSIKIVFLGRLGEMVGEDGTLTYLGDSLDWGTLQTECGKLPGGGVLVQDLNRERVHIAVNGEVLANKEALQASDGDEVAVLPPVSGG